MAAAKSGIVAFRVTAGLMAQIDGVRRALDAEAPAAGPHSRTDAIYALLREGISSRRLRRGGK
jgi:hypothetical protein